MGSSQRDESASRANEGSSRANDVRTAGNVVRTGADDVVVERPANRIRSPSATGRSFSSAWCRPLTPERGSTERVRAGKTYGHAHCLGAPGYFRESASGEIGLAVPGCRIRLVELLTRTRCAKMHTTFWWPESTGQPRRPFRRLDAFEPRQRFRKHLLVQEQDRPLGLVLRRGRHAFRHREVRWVRNASISAAPRVAGVSLVVCKASHPIDVGPARSGCCSACAGYRSDPGRGPRDGVVPYPYRPPKMCLLSRFWEYYNLSKCLICGTRRSSHDSLYRLVTQKKSTF